jgi:microcystin-dependent protein
LLEAHHGAEVMLPRPFDSAEETPAATGCSGKTIPECASEAIAQVDSAEQNLMVARADLDNSTAAIGKIYSTKEDVNATVARLEHVIKGAAAMVPVGTILTLSGSGRKAPEGFALCDGSPLSRAAYAELFGAIGTTWGAGDQVTTFNVPDLRGRTMVGAGLGKSLTARKVGDYGGEESHRLAIAEVPKHEHLYSEVSTSVTVWQYAAVGTGHFPATLASAHHDTHHEGEGQAHSNTQPYAVAAFYIKVGTPHSAQVILI